MCCCYCVVVLVCYPIPLAVIVVGGLHIDDCPVNNHIPIWLIVGGCCGICCIVKALIVACLRKDNNPYLPVNVFAWSCCIWFITGLIFVAPNWSKYTSNMSSDNYCDDDTMKFSLALLILTGILIPLYVGYSIRFVLEHVSSCS
jgi:hypothetical protein